MLSESFGEGQIVEIIYSLFILSILQAAMLHLTIMIAQDQSPKISESLHVVISRYGSIMKAMLYVGVKVGLGALLIIPGIIWLYQYMFVTIEVLLGANTKEAMEKSTQLTHGVKLKMFGFHFLFLIVIVAVTAFLAGMLDSFFNINRFTSVGVLLFFFTLIYLAAAVVNSYLYVFWTTLYLQRRQDVCGESLSTSVSALITTLSHVKSDAAQQILKKYEHLQKDLSSSDRSTSGFIVKK